MLHKVFGSIAFLSFLLAACSSPAPTPTPVPPTAAPTATVIPPTATSAPSLTPTSLPTQTQTPAPTFTPTIPPPTSTGLFRRLPTGTYVVDNRVASIGELDVTNDQDLDAIVLLATFKETFIVLAVCYVRAHEKFTINRISDGTYNYYVATGEDWDNNAAAFTRRNSFFMYDVGIPFRSSRTTTTVFYTKEGLPINPNLAVVKSLTAAQFPKFK